MGNRIAHSRVQGACYLYADEGLLAESIQAITLNADGTVTAATTPGISAQYGPTPDAEFTTCGNHLSLNDLI